MKKIIKGVTYNTETAAKMFHINNEVNGTIIHTEVYRKQVRRNCRDELNFKYFKDVLYKGTHTIEALTYAETMKLLEERYSDSVNEVFDYGYCKEMLNEEKEIMKKLNDVNPEYSYAEKCSIIDEFFEMCNLTYIRGEAPSDWFDFDFSEETFTMNCECYSIGVQTDGWIGVSTEPDCSIGDIDIEFLHNLYEYKYELVECIKENHLLD